MQALLHELVTSRAEARPEALAVVAGRQRLRYRELEETSNRIGQLLTDTGCGRGDRVGVLLPKGPDAVVALLGTLKCGAAFVVLDPADPVPLLAQTLRAADCRWLLTAGDDTTLLREVLAAARPIATPLIGWLGPAPPAGGPRFVFVRDDLAAYPSTQPRVAVLPADAAQLSFTARSDGAPRAVVLSHAALAGFLDWARSYFGITAESRLSQEPPLRSRLATFELFGGLSAGATVCFVPRQLDVEPRLLAKFIRDSRLTQWQSVPTTMTLMARLDVIRAGDFPNLRHVLFSGEVMPAPTLMYWMRQLPHAQFTNLYGATATTIASCFYTLPGPPQDPRAEIPLGSPCPGTELLVLDRALEPVPPGEVGELHVGGAGMADGYWRDPEATAVEFVAVPAGSAERYYRTGDRARLGGDGLYYYCGRVDAQVERGGKAIPLDTIEAALHEVPELVEGAIVAIDAQNRRRALLCCAYVPGRDAELSERGLESRLADLLPSHLLPVRWRRYELLPRDPVGRIDHARLATEFRSAEAGHSGH